MKLRKIIINMMILIFFGSIYSLNMLFIIVNQLNRHLNVFIYIYRHKTCLKYAFSTNKFGIRLKT